MAMASVSESGWEVSEKSRPLSVLVQLRQRIYVLPWSLFLYAEGTEVEVRAVFHTHLLLMQGSGLSALLSDFADQGITQLLEPDRTAKFSRQRGPQITALSVTENK